MSRIQQLHDAGQAVWLDYIKRSFTESGELAALVQQGVRGVTSNPTIFEKAIAGGTEYDASLARLVAAGRSAADIYESLAFEDIGRAADVLRPVWEETDGADGFVSLEVSPTLAHDTDGTVAEARRLFAALGRPNVMIKIPGTAAGVPAIAATIGSGVNVNVTLLFSVAQYVAVAEAYIEGLETLRAAGGDLARVGSVASFFVSRVDTAVDAVLATIEGGEAVQGKAAIANAKMAYARFQELFSSPCWQALAAHGARVQRPLWASTGTKNPAYPDTLYVDQLIGPDTVNTLPPATLDAFLDHGIVAPTLTQEVAAAHDLLVRLDGLGIDMTAITERLQEEGVKSFADSFIALIGSIEGKRGQMPVRAPIRVELGEARAAVDAALRELTEGRVLERLWARDHTLWSDDPTEISNRLGWLNVAEEMRGTVDRLTRLAAEVRAEGFTHAVVIGMGGSSLAPEVFAKTFGGAGLTLTVLDSTHPDAVLALAQRLDLARTLFVVSTKSGSTVETFSLFTFFYNRVAADRPDAGRQFVAITDAGSALQQTAERCSFRAVFLANPEIGGRYAALSHFGLVPAALVGVDLNRLLDRATAAMQAHAAGSAPAECPAVVLGAALAELARQGRDKLTIVTAASIPGFGDWAEQLIAESTGKHGLGILPVVGEPLQDPTAYAEDRVFVQVAPSDDATEAVRLDALAAAGHPVIRLSLDDPYDLGAQFFLWEMAVAVAGVRLRINPFDQPNVESAKQVTRQMLAAFKQQGALPTLPPALTENGVTVYGEVPGRTLAEMLRAFVLAAPRQTPRPYLAVQAYIPPDPETDAVLLSLRTHLEAASGLAVTTGYGPRFLHSTGQLHKGDAGRGLFLQLTSTPQQDAPIPDEPGSDATSVSFGTLIDAQALGDRQALLDAGRRVLRLHLNGDVARGLAHVTQAVT